MCDTFLFLGNIAQILSTSQTVTGASEQTRFVFLCTSLKGISMDVNSECWKQQRAGQDSTSAIAWRRSGDESDCGRPLRAARPNSCLEGRLKDEWLQKFSNLQTDELPHYLQPNKTSRSNSPSLVTSSQSSLESLHSGVKSKERVQIKTGPSTQRAKVCCFAPVRIGWLPLQRHVVRTERINIAAQQDGTTCKVQLKPPITPLLSCSFVKAKGELGEGAAGRWVRGMSGAIALQADNKRKATLAKRDQGTALEGATGVQNTSRDRILWQSPMQRRGSVPQVFLRSPPTTGGRTSPKNSSSISSITITSRKVIRSSSLPDTSLFGQDRDKESSSMDPNNFIGDPDYQNTSSRTKVTPQRKALIVKITEQRVDTRRFLQPGAKTGPNCSHTTTGEHYFSPFSTNSDLTATNPSSVKNQPLLTSSNVTGRDNDIPESHSQVLSCPATQEPQLLRVLQRKATMDKVQEERNDMRPQLAHEHMLSSSRTKHFKSTVSFQLTSASNGAQVGYPCTSRGFQPRRPASCYASLFSPVESKADGSQDAAVHSTALLHQTNIDPACSAASSLNRCCSTEEEAGSHDTIYPRTGSCSASDKGQSKRESALLRNQPLTLIRVPDRSTHETYDAIVARNAAAIIANIKLQSEQKKKTQASGNTNGGRDKAAESSGSGSK